MNIEKIWQQYEVSLRNFIRIKVSNEADAEDLLQDIMIKTLTNLDDIKKQTSIKSWLFQIANNTIIDFYRKNARRNTLAALESNDSHDDTSVKQAMLKCISPFINELPEADAKLLLEIEIENRSQKDYAQEIGLSYSTLKSRVQKSRRKLKSVFETCCDFKKDKMGNVYDFVDKRKFREKN